MNKTIYNVSNMTCMGCVKVVKNTSLQAKGVSDAEVNLEDKTLVITHRDDFKPEDLEKELLDLGYGVTPK
ncbi:MAG: heavy-metal-associated domain-containing protein [Acholeplasmataceae bacterium]|nr:heavy-metal-associated domain-containing protein [Acholeplasmataceae bacterium]